MFFLEGLESRKNFEILLVESSGSFYHLRKENSLIDISSMPSSSGYSNYRYSQCIKPALPQLVEMCGAFYIEDKKNQLVKTSPLPAEIQNVDIIKINWKKKFHFVYPISPQIIPKQEEFGQALYSLYQKEQLCDFNLISKDQTIKVHSTVLYAYGGPVLRALLTADMQEKVNRTLALADYSQRTVKTFLDFVYLGGEAFLQKFISSHDENPIDLFELFKMANYYQVEILINCCTNLMSLFVTKENLEDIKTLVELYDNQHLKSLCDYLSPPPANLIKV